jgi:hypothetical protein
MIHRLMACATPKADMRTKMMKTFNRSTSSSGNNAGHSGKLRFPTLSGIYLAGQSQSGHHLLIVSGLGVTGFDGLVL